MTHSKHFSKVMRSFHNNVKGSLIQRALSLIDTSTIQSERRLLDVGVGRGGDMFKWDRYDLQHVLGYDPSDAYIEEANRRFSQSNLSHRDYKYVCCEHINDLQQSSHSFDVVSCQFVIHYFFTSEDVVRDFLTQVHRVLKPGGAFVGTFMDGDQVLKHTNDGTIEFLNDALLMYIPESSPSLDVGRPLHVHLTGTLYFGENSVSHEFIVKKEVLTRLCQSVGLVLHAYAPFQWHHAQCQGHFKLSDDYKACSYMYTSFVFMKPVL